MTDASGIPATLGASSPDTSWNGLSRSLARASNLTERAAASHARRANDDAGRFHASSWLKQPQFVSADRLELRARAIGRNTAGLLELIAQGEPEADDPSGWQACILDVMRNHARSWVASQPPPATPLGGLSPIITHCMEAVQRSVDAVVYPPSLIVRWGLIESTLEQHLLTRCAPKMIQVHVLELNVARLRGELVGDSPEARFSAFCGRFSNPDEVARLFAEYPVLARELATTGQAFVASLSEMMQRLAADWDAIAMEMGWLGETCELTGLKLGAGDSHGGGRSVAILEFSGGRQLVYKPRSIATEVRFHELLAMLDDGSIGQKRLRMLDRECYGWVEFVHADACTDQESVARFYERLGFQLAVLYVLEATDFHLENVLASGEWPVLVDLETLFHPRLGDVPPGLSPELIGWRAMDRSVLRVGMLPRQTFLSADNDGIEMSGLGGQGGQLTPDRLLVYDRLGTDQMSAARRRVPISGGSNVPRVGQVRVTPSEYTDELVSGFRQGYERLLATRDTLLDAPIAAFANAPTRVIIRHTRHYAVLLKESYHPDLLRDARARDRYFDVLWANVGENNVLAPVIPAEQRDLWRGDVPVFTSAPASVDIWDAFGTRYDKFLARSGLAGVRDRIAELSPRDLELQEWVIRASMGASAKGATRSMTAPDPHAQRLVHRTTAPHALHLAHTVADRILDLGIHDDGAVSWLSMGLEGERSWAIKPLGLDLYAGLAGIGLFLLHAARHGHAASAAVSAAIARTLCEAVEAEPQMLDGVGAFGGRAGLVYYLTHAGSLSPSSRCLDAAERELARLEPRIEDDESLDIISGCSGLILVANALNRVRPNALSLRVMQRAADHLIARAEPQERGVAWHARVEASRPLCGVSHGAAGMALALGTAAAALRVERYWAAAMGACEYEDDQYDADLRNWPDFRVLDDAHAAAKSAGSTMSAWCHGAPGILAVRARLSSLAGAWRMPGSCDLAWTATTTHERSANHSLCHGEVGNLECALEARDLVTFPDAHASHEAWTAEVLQSIAVSGPVSGVPLDAEVPGLMMGHAGVGMGLLKIAVGLAVPSVLLLDPPSQHKTVVESARPVSNHHGSRRDA